MLYLLPDRSDKFARELALQNATELLKTDEWCAFIFGHFKRYVKWRKNWVVEQTFVHWYLISSEMFWSLNRRRIGASCKSNIKLVFFVFFFPSIVKCICLFACFFFSLLFHCHSRVHCVHLFFRSEYVCFYIIIIFSGPLVQCIGLLLTIHTSSAMVFVKSAAAIVR